MNLAIGAINAYSGISAIRPLNYSVTNQSEVSSTSKESAQDAMSIGAFPNIDAVNPVQYPNAQSIAVDPMKKLEQTQSVSKDLNEIASGFTGIATGYGSDSKSYGYQMIGSTIDIYA